MQIIGSFEKPWKIIASIRNNSNTTFIINQESAPIINGTAKFTKFSVAHMTSSLIVEFAIEAKDTFNL